MLLQPPPPGLTGGVGRLKAAASDLRRGRLFRRPPKSAWIP
jgi:hypothetical protein